MYTLMINVYIFRKSKVLFKTNDAIFRGFFFNSVVGSWGDSAVC